MFSSTFDTETVGVVVAGNGFPDTRDCDGLINQQYLTSVIDVLNNLQRVGDSFLVYIGETLKPALDALILMFDENTSNKAVFVIRSDGDPSTMPKEVNNILVLSESSSEINTIISELTSTHNQSLKWILNPHYRDGR